MMGSHRIHSASYHSQSNGMIERFHRHLKSAHEDTGGSDTLPIVLLGLRSAMKNDLKATSSQLVYGTTLRLPSDLISSESLQTSVTPTYVSKLITMMRKLSPISPDSHSCRKSYVHQSLSICTHVFLRNDKIRPPLTPPYTGPHLVKSRSDKNFVICINNKNVTVTIDRCKPAFEFSEDFNSQKSSSNFEAPLTKQQIEDKTVVDKNIRTTHSGISSVFPEFHSDEENIYT
ncbi:transposon Ty3-G Gag-Pol polyprotein [Trichonephila clavipes]|nr:transposon Ty3-G Gag-Pol polyprotein [Trichonephila clavipes]